MKPIGILTSTPAESDILLSELVREERISLSGGTVHRGKLSGHDVLLMITGIGKVNAAHAVTVLLEHFPLRLIINCGVGGAYPQSCLDIGDIAIASKELYGDEGVFGSSFRGMREIGIPVLRSGKKEYFNEFPLDIGLLKGIKQDDVVIGPFVTLSSVSGSYERARELGRRFNAICENMEGAAIAHVCKIYNIPVLEIRGISNITGIRDKRRWNLRVASENCQRFVMELIKSL